MLLYRHLYFPIIEKLLTEVIFGKKNDKDLRGNIQSCFRGYTAPSSVHPKLRSSQTQFITGSVYHRLSFKRPRLKSSIIISSPVQVIPATSSHTQTRSSTPPAVASFLFCFNSESNFLCFKSKIKLAIVLEPVYFCNLLFSRYIFQFGCLGANSLLSA